MKGAFLPSLVLAATLCGCQTASTPPPAKASVPIHGETAEKSRGTVRVNATTLNIRKGPSAGAPVIATARRGEKLELLGSEQSWSRVRLADGSMGWVSSKHIAPFALKTGCLPARNFSFVQAPPLSFSDGGPKGTVTVEASVDASGQVKSTDVSFSRCPLIAFRRAGVSPASSRSVALLALIFARIPHPPGICSAAESSYSSK